MANLEGSNPPRGTNKINRLANIGQDANFCGGTQGEHFTANFVIKGVGVKSQGSKICKYPVLTFFI